MFLPVAAIAVVALALRNLQTARGTIATLARVTLVGSFVAALVWRAAPSPTIASAVLSLFLIAVLLTLFLRDDSVAAAASLIATSTALFLIMASDTHEALVFYAGARVPGVNANDDAEPG